MSANDARSLAGQKLGNYRLQKILGRGNMGVVYLATDEALLRPTAVKILAWAPTGYDPEAWFLAEARSVARLNHPSVVQIYSVARHGPYCYIAMEYVEGVSADVLVARRGVFSPERATEVILQVTAALDLAHGAKIIHRDVKPANILIKHDGTAKLGDFGTAMSDHTPPNARPDARPVARPGAPPAKPALRAGTPHYFAPEIWRGEPATVSSDLYALGATYYYLLTGRPPFDAAKLDELATAHQKLPVPVPAGAPAVCARLIARAMAKSPADRFESARAMAWELRGALRELEAASITGGGMTPSAEMIVKREVQALRPASPAWQARGFATEPFAELDPTAPPASGAPFDGLRRELAAQLQVAGTTLLLAGAPRSGRSTLARWMLTTVEPGAAAYIDLAQPTAQQGSLARRIARAFGAVSNPSAVGSAALEGLLELLGRTAASPSVRIVVVDGVVPGSRAAADIAVLARAARTTRYFSMLVIGPGELAADLADPTRPGASGGLITMPALTAPQVRDYLASWLAATRRPEAPPLLVTVDAALLVAHRTEGQLGRLNALARELVATDRRVLTSWDAWSAPDGIGEHTADRRLAPERPADWPTADILRLLNQCRAAAGILERAP